jgi:LysM repeat protein
MAVRRPSLRRSLGFAGLATPLLFVVGLSACGDDDDAAQSTVIIQPSSYSTQLSTTAPAQSGESGGSLPAGVVAGTQVYEVQSGDFLAAIASDFGIPPESIANFNQWEDGVNHMLHPDMVIHIPPGAQAPSANDDEGEEDSSESEDTEEDEEPVQAEVDPDDPPECPNGDPQGTYTIEAGDIPARVAESLDVTLDQLNEANANTPGFRGFIVGTDILVPCGED